MWDFSWLLRHHPCGEFEDWDAVLDGLVERGYNAIRLDVFPNLVAADAQGRVTEEFHFPKGDWGPAMWGNKPLRAGELETSVPLVYLDSAARRP